MREIKPHNVFRYMLDVRKLAIDKKEKTNIFFKLDVCRNKWVSIIRTYFIQVLSTNRNQQTLIKIAIYLSAPKRHHYATIKSFRKIGYKNEKFQCKIQI